MALSFNVNDIERLTASKYVNAVGMMILLWDHILTFPDEVQLIWKARLSSAKVLFLVNRYMVPFTMIVQTHEFSGLEGYLSLACCKAWYAIGVSVGTLSIATTNFLILLRLWVIWDRSPRLVLSTLTLFIVTQLVTIGCAAYVIYDLMPNLAILARVHACIPIEKPKLMVIWVPGLVFEFVVFATTVWNALDRPRPQDLRMAKILYRDGCLYFLCLFVSRLANMLLSVFAPASLSFVGIYFLWSFCNITLARLVFNLRRLSTKKTSTGQHSTVQDGCDDDDHHHDGEKLVEEEDVKNPCGGDVTELPVLHKQCLGHGAQDRADTCSAQYTLGISSA